MIRIRQDVRPNAGREEPGNRLRVDCPVQEATERHTTRDAVSPPLSV